MTEQKSKQQQIPAYLNKACLQKALQKALSTNCSFEFENVQWQLANIVGGNYCSNIYRVNGKYNILKGQQLNEINKSEEFHFIIKDMDMEMVEDGTNEMTMLTKIVPEMIRILESQPTSESLETSNKLAANCFLTESNKDHEFYVLEDLTALGFELGNRYQGLNLKQAKLVLEKIAKFHAASMIYGEKNPDVIANLKISSFAEPSEEPPSKNLTKKCIRCAMEILDMPDDGVASQIKKFMLGFKQKAAAVATPTPGGFNVLNHADLWVNNILFKEPESDKGDAIFVDFQNTFWGSPAIDLNYFLYSSLPLVTLQTQRFELLHHYYKTLKSLLQSLNHSKIPTWSDLLKEFRRGAVIAFYVALCEFPFCVATDEAVKDFKLEEFIISTTQWELLYKTPKVRQFIWHAILHFQEIGLLDE